MATLEITQPIGVPPEHVYVFFVPQRMPYWYGVEIDSRFEVQGCAPEFMVGLRLRISGRVGNRNVSQSAVVTACEYGRMLEWSFEDEYGVRGTERWELDRVAAPGGTGTIVKFKSDYVVPGFFGRVLDRLLTRRAVARRSREYLQRLARLAEHRA